jgi:hypothetical protein
MEKCRLNTPRELKLTLKFEFQPLAFQERIPLPICAQKIRRQNTN